MKEDVKILDLLEGLQRALDMKLISKKEARDIFLIAIGIKDA